MISLHEMRVNDTGNLIVFGHPKQHDKILLKLPANTQYHNGEPEAIADGLTGRNDDPANRLRI